MSSDKAGAKPPPPKRAAKQSDRADRSVGDALRAAYQDTVCEDVPSEMLDLLNKLG